MFSTREGEHTVSCENMTVINAISIENNNVAK